MSDDEVARIEGEERTRLIALYRQTRARVFIECARMLRRSGPTADLADLLAPEVRAEGRPAISDMNELVDMHLMVMRGEARSISAAAKMVAKRWPEHLRPSTFDRLRSKAASTPDAKRRAEVMRRVEVEHQEFVARMEVIRQQLASEDAENSAS